MRAKTSLTLSFRRKKKHNKRTRRHLRARRDRAIMYAIFFLFEREHHSLIHIRSAHAQHKYSTANFKISHRKLNKLGRQLSGKPIDSAILQMTFSEKRASKRIRNMLVVAKSHAALKGIDPKKMVVGTANSIPSPLFFSRCPDVWFVLFCSAEAWVTKGPRQYKRMEPRGRCKFGIRVHPDSRLSVVLKEGRTRQELLDKERARKLKRIVSAGLVREDKPLRNPSSMWTW